jgi:sucrose-6-phosphate hydrolase SacC (GH32 family)
MQCIPRALALRTIAGEIHLCQDPVVELQRLRGRHRAWPAQTLAGKAEGAAAKGLKAGELELAARFAPGSARECGFRLELTGDGLPGVDAYAGYAAQSGQLFVQTGDGPRTAIPLRPHGGEVRLRLFIDRGVIELFAGAGEATLTALLEPQSLCADVQPYARDSAKLLACEGWEMGSAWEEVT